MCEESLRKGRTQTRLVFVLVLVAVGVAWLLTPTIVSAWSGSSAQPGQTCVGVFGDQFGAINSLFAGLAFAALVFSIFLQREELRSQREELALQREELKRSVEEMERSADAQAAQVKINTLSAMLASLPVLIQEEENRIVSLSECHGTHTLDRAFLSTSTVEILVNAEKTLAHAVETYGRRREEKEAEIGQLQARTREIESEAPPGKRPGDWDFEQSLPADTYRQYAEVVVQLGQAQDALTKLCRSGGSDEASLPAVRRLIALRQELADTYEQMKAFREWEGTKAEDSGQVAESDT